MMNDESTANWRRKFISGVLLLCTVLGVALRFVGLNWDEGFHLHPDERFLCIITPQLGWPHSIAEYFDSSRAPLNPFNGATDFFVYGQLPLVIVKAIASIFGRDDYQNILLVGRFVSAFFETGALLLIFLIGRRAGSTQLGLLAAALLGFTALHIQHAHFWVVDPFATFFIAAAFLFAQRAFEKSSVHRVSSIACGLCFGAALACKFSSLLFGILIVIFALSNFERSKNIIENKKTAGAALRAMLLIFLTAFIGFRVLHPIAFRGEGEIFSLWGLLDIRLNSQFFAALAEQQKITSGQIDVPFNLQWFEQAPYLFPLFNLGNWAMGWPLLCCAFAGIALAVARVLQRADQKQSVLMQKIEARFIIVAAIWCLIVFIFYGAQFSKFTRYYLAAMPFAALVAAWFLLEIHPRAKTKNAKLAAKVFISGVLLSALLWALAIASIYTRPHPRVAASRWIHEHIPPGTAIANETAWDESLPLYDATLWPARNLDLFAPDDENKCRNLLQSLDEAQWIFVSSPRVWKIVPLLPARFPMTAAYYRALFNGQLGFRLEKEFASYPAVAKFEFRDENVEESLTVYDHPRVLLFVKTEKYSTLKTRQILHQALEYSRPLQENVSSGK